MCLTTWSRDPWLFKIRSRFSGSSWPPWRLWAGGGWFSGEEKLQIASFVPGGIFRGVLGRDGRLMCCQRRGVLLINRGPFWGMTLDMAVSHVGTHRAVCSDPFTVLLSLNTLKRYCISLSFTVYSSSRGYGLTVSWKQYAMMLLSTTRKSCYFQPRYLLQFHSSPSLTYIIDPRAPCEWSKTLKSRVLQNTSSHVDDSRSLLLLFFWRHNTFILLLSLYHIVLVIKWLFL